MQDINELYFPEWVKKEWKAIISKMEEFSSIPEGKQFLVENDPRMALVMRDPTTARLAIGMKDVDKSKTLPEGLLRVWNEIVDHMEAFESSIAGQWFLRENDPRELVSNLK